MIYTQFLQFLYESSIKLAVNKFGVRYIMISLNVYRVKNNIIYEHSLNFCLGLFNVWARYRLLTPDNLYNCVRDETYNISWIHYIILSSLQFISCLVYIIFSQTNSSCACENMIGKNILITEEKYLVNIFKLFVEMVYSFVGYKNNLAFSYINYT